MKWKEVRVDYVYVPRWLRVGEEELTVAKIPLRDVSGSGSSIVFFKAPARVADTLSVWYGTLTLALGHLRWVNHFGVEPDRHDFIKNVLLPAYEMDVAEHEAAVAAKRARRQR